MKIVSGWGWTKLESEIVSITCSRDVHHCSTDITILSFYSAMEGRLITYV